MLPHSVLELSGTALIQAGLRYLVVRVSLPLDWADQEPSLGRALLGCESRQADEPH